MRSLSQCRSAISINQFKATDFFQSFSSRPNNILKGDTKVLSELKENELLAITKYFNPSKVKYFQAKPFYSEKLYQSERQDMNKSRENEDEDEVNSLGEKNLSYSYMSKMSTEFFLKLYKEGTTSSASTDFDDAHKKSKLTFEPDNPFVFSFTHLHPLSFFTGNKTFCFSNKKKNILQFPAPTIITSEQWTQRPDLTKEGILKGLQISDKTGLVLVDPITSAKFRGIVTNLIKQILLAALGNKISLLVRMFEPKSLLERIGYMLSFANKFLIPASEPKITPLQRMKLIMALGVSGLYMNAQQLKPFNPLLGETFQGEFENGGNFYIELICSKPLVARFLMTHGDDFQVSGFFDVSVRPEGLGNVIYIYHKGPVTVKFLKIKEEITYNYPTIKLCNARAEKDRASYWNGNINYVDVKNKLRGLIKLAENPKKIHEIKGIIFNYKFPHNYKFVYCEECEFGKKFKLNHTKNYKVLAKLSGSWLENITFGNEEFWNINTDKPEWIRPMKSCLPSDGRFREDLIWLFRSFYDAKNEEERLKYESISQEWKILLEKFHRLEREIRAKNRPKKNHR